MKRNIFYLKKYNFYNKLLFLFFIILIIFTIILFILIYKNIRSPYFKLSNSIGVYYTIPTDKGGEEVKYLDKKSINNINLNNEISNDSSLGFTIQIYSSSDLSELKNYMQNFINQKQEIVNKSELYIFSLTSDIGIDYFLTYKSFYLKNDALEFCNNFKIINDCIIINHIN